MTSSGAESHFNKAAVLAFVIAKALIVEANLPSPIPYVLIVLSPYIAYNNMATPRVLILGGHGKVALRLTPLLLARSWNVTSLVHNPEHEADILRLGEGQKGRVEVLVSSLDEVKNDNDARAILDLVRPNYVVWSAGPSLPSSSMESLNPPTRLALSALNNKKEERSSC
jgi:hypothetical protein